MSNDTTNGQGKKKGRDGFSVQQGPATPGEGGAPGAAGPLSPAARELAAKRWDVRGPALADRVAARYRGEEPFVPMPKEWRRLSRAMAGLAPDGNDAAPHGWRPGVYYITAGTGAGKSQFAMQCAVAAAVDNVPTGIIGLELDDLGLYTRAASVACGATDDTNNPEWERTPWSAFYNGRVACVPSGVQKVLEDLPIYPDEPDAHLWPAEKLDTFVDAMREAESARRVARGVPALDGNAPVFVVLDFLQLVGASTDNPRAELRERIGKAAYRARMVAREKRAVVLVLSSVPRAAYSAALVDPEHRQTEKPPKEASPASLRAGADLVGLGKESGDVEFSADGVIVLCPHKREHTNLYEHNKWEALDVCIAKLRTGKANVWVGMEFDGTRFRETRRQPPSAATSSNMLRDADPPKSTTPASRGHRQKKAKAPQGPAIDDGPDHPADDDA